MTVIDVHTHVYTRPWLELLRSRGGKYRLMARPDGQEQIFFGDTPVSLPQAGHFDYGLRIKNMNAAGIDISIVSLTAPNVYWGDEEVSCEAARESNDSMCEAQKAYTDRIRWFTSLPWEYPQRAVQELARTSDKGAIGVMVLANVNGRSLTDPLFEPIWQEIDRRAMPVLVHPTDPPGTDLLDMANYDLSWSVGFMFDTTLAIARMIFDGFLDRYSKLKLIASHGGGALPYLVGRFEKGNEVALPAQRKMRGAPRDYLRSIYYDSITYDAGALQYLISVVGADRVMIGTDWPHIVHDSKGSIAKTEILPAEQREAIRSENAKHIFAI